MPIYSIISEDDIFAAPQDSVAPTVSTMNINGGCLEISEQNGRRQVRRLFSTNPAMYLDKRYQPYSEIKP